MGNRKVQLLVLLALLWTGCQWEAKRAPSILILAVDSLSSDQVSCTDQDTDDTDPTGLDILCAESVRFTHAYTPSVLSQPALTSLLTAKWPYQHGVLHNGSNFLSSTEETAVELAFKKKYRTAFISGGAPIWKKSGLSQGFEIFDDYIPVGKDRFYRTFQESSDIFLNWLKKEVGKESFLATIYVADLQFFDLPQTGPEGGPVETSYEGRLDFLNQGMGSLFQALKEQNRWDDTYIFLVGLNGRPTLDRAKELDGYNLLSENSQVALLIKPPRAKRDLGLQWKIDLNVSLVDVGLTLFDLLGREKVVDSPFEVVSLKQTLTSPEADWDPDRGILIGSGWCDWHDTGHLRLGIRRGHQFYLHEFPPKIYNSLIDRMEISPLRPANAKWAEAVSFFAPFTATIKTGAWTPPPADLLKKMAYARALWSSSTSPASVEQFLASRMRDPQVAGWFAQRALERAQWDQLLKVGKAYKNQGWVYLAAQKIKQKSDLPPTPCFKIWQQYLAKSSALPHLKTCDDPVFRDLFSWISESSTSEAAYYRDTFLRNYAQVLLDRRIGELNYVNGLVWDVSTLIPNGPTEGEILLNLPENQKFLAVTNEKMNSRSL